jgi:hypothetical protein
MDPGMEEEDDERRIICWRKIEISSCEELLLSAILSSEES